MYTHADTCESTRACTHSHTSRMGHGIPSAASGSSVGMPGSSSFRNSKPTHPRGFPFYHSSLALIYSCQQNVSFPNSVGILHFFLGVIAGSQVIHAPSRAFLSNVVCLLFPFSQTWCLAYKFRSSLTSGHISFPSFTSSLI